MDTTLTMQMLTTKNGRELLTRRLTGQDAGALQQFNAALSDASRSRFLPHGYDDLTVQKVLARAEAGEDLILGVFDGARIVGYFFLWYFKQRVPLLGIGLLDEFHGSGLGAQMMRILIEAAGDNGNEGIELTTVPDNHRAFALYEKVGFTYYGDVENLDGDGRIVTERGMFYEIVPGAHRFDGPHRPPV